MSTISETAEYRRVHEDGAAWQLWGPYLSERQWGTVREDYSRDGDAWDYLPHDHARSRAYRWGEDGIAGFSDDRQRWCLGIALWNGRDAILKERMFGLTNGQGNHGEDVKELWWYSDATPSHSYVRMLYKYPQAAFPYAELIAENARRRGHDEREYELVDTGVFAGNRYFDVTVEYAQAEPGDVLMRVTAVNRGPDAAPLHILPHLWARNTWSWNEGAVQPRARLSDDGTVIATRNRAPDYRLAAYQPGEWLFCENETNGARLFGEPAAGYPKDAIGRFVVDGEANAVNPGLVGSKCASHATFEIPAGGEVSLRLRFAPAKARKLSGKAFDAAFAQRIAEADEYYAALQHEMPDEDQRRVQRQALAGMIWSKQYYRFDVRRWLAGDPTQPPPPPERLHGRDSTWRHLDNADIVSMPDKWEYPWYAAWDLAFHCVAFALIDPAFAKKQLRLLTLDGYMNPNGALPAYEWNFSDVNPPVQAWAAWRIYEIDRAHHGGGTGDLGFLEQMLHKLMLNFTWWVNRVDPDGRNVFQGGFLGLDNIGVFDRSKPLPTGGHIVQSDGTAWMAMFSLDLMRIALEIAQTNPAYEDIATKFFDHFLLIAEAMTDLGDDAEGLWDERDHFYYDRLTLPDGHEEPLRVRSLVGLIPLCAVDVLDGSLAPRFPAFAERLRWTLVVRPKLAELVSRWQVPGQEGRMLLSLLRRQRMTALLSRMFDEAEFLSPHGIRSVSKAHEAHPYVYDAHGAQFSVEYAPGESKTMMFGGNSNWRGPVWMPINVLLVEALYEFESFYGEGYTIEFPTGSGERVTLAQAADRLRGRLASLFLRDGDGRRPIYADNALFQEDPHFRDHVHFHEYFHGDTGEGLGASHQTGWTGLVALLFQPRARDAGKLVAAKHE